MRNGPHKKLFGTDGIRSRVGEFPFDSHSLIRFGYVFGKLWNSSKILIGRDTRDSGSYFEQLIASELRKTAEVCTCKVIPTPAMSYILDHSDFDYGIMITASHNPFFDNGIKIFTGNGEKISPEEESCIEEIFHSREGRDGEKTGSGTRQAAIPDYGLGRDLYWKFLLDQVKGLGLGHLKLVVDCANGATHEIAPRVFRELGANLFIINASPNGKNINEKCGSTSLENLKATVLSKKADCGIAFDGDGDRVLFVDRDGFVLDGDHCLFIISEYLTAKDNDFNRVIVGTHLSNLGMEKALKERGIDLIRTDVGDKFVYEEMKNRNSILGGEKSGHIILRNLQKSGDGILTALFFLKSILSLKIKIGDVKRRVILFPQIEVNIPIREKKDLKEWEELDKMVMDFNSRFHESARILVRYSGTEPKIRIMMESKDKSIIDEKLNPFVDLIQSTIGEKDEIGS